MHLKKKDISFWLDNESQFWLNEQRHREFVNIKNQQKKLKENMAVYDSGDSNTIKIVSGNW